MSVIALASFTAQVIQAEGTFGVFGSGIVEQEVTTSPLEDFSAATTIVPTGTGTGAGGGGATPTDGGASAATAAGTRVRWTGSRITWIDEDLHPTATHGEIAYEEDMSPGRQTTFRFQTVGHLWSMPTQEDFDDTPPDPGDPAPPAPPEPPEPGDPDTSPRPWGNKPVEAYLSLGQSPRSMVETKIFKGLSLQKSNRGDTAILGEITCVDESILYADVPLCYELQPFAGKRRGEITREMALAVGVPADKIHVPVGNLVTKPILLSNGSLLTFLNEFWKGENGWAYFDENGDLVVELVNLKDTPDWTLDASLGDYDLDSFEEVPPTRPPSRYYVKATTPVAGGGATGGPGDGVETVTDEQEGPYNPKCVKVRPSGQPSHLQANGQYCVNAADSVMVIGRTVTETNTVAGRQSQKVVRKYGWYNPVAYDPNFNTAPPGTSYDGAYGDRTFHRDEAETFMLVSTETTAYSYDTNGTLLREVFSLEGWYAPHRAGNYAADRVTLTNGNGAYVFPCTTSRIQPVETYQTVERIEKVYIFDGNGVLTRTSEKTFNWYAASSACDLYLDSVTGGAVPPPTSTYQSPCPGGYTPIPGSGGGEGGGVVDTGPPPFQPVITGPTPSPVTPNQTLYFFVSMSGIPTGLYTLLDLVLTQYVRPATLTHNPAGYWDITYTGSTAEKVYDPVGGLVPSPPQYGDLEHDVPINIPQEVSGLLQAPYAKMVARVLSNDGNTYVSEPLYFDSRIHGSLPGVGGTTILF